MLAVNRGVLLFRRCQSPSHFRLPDVCGFRWPRGPRGRILRLAEAQAQGQSGRAAACGKSLVSHGESPLFSRAPLKSIYKNRVAESSARVQHEANDAWEFFEREAVRLSGTRPYDQANSGR